MVSTAENLVVIGETRTGNTTIALEIGIPADDLEKLQGEKLTVDIKKFREKRSLDSNSYYWTLVSKIADAAHTSAPYVHNDMLRKYGQIELLDGKPVYLVIPDTEEAEKAVHEAETYHLKPTSQVKEGTDGKMYRTYLMLRGSHGYDTKEMSTLIDGVVSEARDLGIETLSPDKLREMMDAYEKHYAKRKG